MFENQAFLIVGQVRFFFKFKINSVYLYEMLFKYNISSLNKIHRKNEPLKMLRCMKIFYFERAYYLIDNFDQFLDSVLVRSSTNCSFQSQ